MDEIEREWYRKTLGLTKGWEVTDVQHHLTPLEVQISVEYVGELSCPVCGTLGKRYDIKRRSWQDLDHGISKCIVYARVPRIRCPVCGVHEVDVPWGGKFTRLSLRLEGKIFRDLMTGTLKDVADRYTVHEHTVRKILVGYSHMMMCELDLSSLRFLAFDETSSRKGHDYISTAIDMDSGAVVFSTHGKDSSTLHECAYWIEMHGGSRKNIRLVCCDMSPAFIVGIRSYFPDAIIIFDRFHVEYAAGILVDTVRKSMGFKGKAGKGIRFVIQKTRADLMKETPELQDRIHKIMEDYKDLGIAYSIKQALHDIYCFRRPCLQVRLFDRIVAYCKIQTNEDIKKFGELLERHRYGIIAYFEYRRTNAVSEGINSGIQSMKAASKGFKDTKLLIAKIYNKYGSRHPSLNNWLLFSDPYHSFVH